MGKEPPRHIPRGLCKKFRKGVAMDYARAFRTASANLLRFDRITPLLAGWIRME
jgi:hypothetical protein